MTRPIISFGQQPCGFFPKRYLYAKIQTARRLQHEIGGEIVLFYHDADHDPRETRTILRHRRTNEPASFNFAVANKIQRKFSPLYLKGIAADWQAKTARQLPNYVKRPLIQLFCNTAANTVADFCLDLYRSMGLLAGIRIVRSSDAEVRRSACEIPEFFVDVSYEGEIVRARHELGELKLHDGGTSYITLPKMTFTKDQVSPTRDTRLRWMQSVVNCTHYITGEGEKSYLSVQETPEIAFIARDAIDRPNEAHTEIP